MKKCGALRWRSWRLTMVPRSRRAGRLSCFWGLCLPTRHRRRPRRLSTSVCGGAWKIGACGMLSIRLPPRQAFPGGRSTNAPWRWFAAMKDEQALRRAAYHRGRRAERLATWWLRLKGYRVLARGWRSRLGEIDLIATRGNVVVFVEVKRREEEWKALQAVSLRQRIGRASCRGRG